MRLCAAFLVREEEKVLLNGWIHSPVINLTINHARRRKYERCNAAQSATASSIHIPPSPDPKILSQKSLVMNLLNAAVKMLCVADFVFIQQAICEKKVLKEGSMYYINEKYNLAGHLLFM